MHPLRPRRARISMQDAENGLGKPFPAHGEVHVISIMLTWPQRDARLVTPHPWGPTPALSQTPGAPTTEALVEDSGEFWANEGHCHRGHGVRLVRIPLGGGVRSMSPFLGKGVTSRHN